LKEWDVGLTVSAYKSENKTWKPPANDNEAHGSAFVLL